MGVSGARQPVDKALNKIKLQVSKKNAREKRKNAISISSIDLRRGSKTFSTKFLNSPVVKPPIMVRRWIRTTYNAKKEEKRSSDKLNHLAYQNCVFLIHCKFDEAQKLPPTCGSWLLILIQVVKTTVTKDTQREWIWNRTRKQLSNSTTKIILLWLSKYC